jgi:hypothetical protein
MGRLAAITAFALFLAVPLWAQHGGGGHAGGGFGGGHAGGFSGGHSAGFAGHSGFSGSHFSGAGPAVHAYSGPRSQAMSRGYASRAYAPVPSARFSTRSSSRPFLHDGFRNSNTHITIGVGGLGFRNGFNNFGFRNGFRNCIGIPCRGGYGWPWWYGGYFDPWLWWDQDYNYDQDYQQNLAQAQQMNEDSLEEQQMRQQEQADGDQDAYARPPAGRSNAGDDRPGASIIPATVLVFRDQHKQEVENYAIVGNALWAFAPHNTQRIPLSELDLTATAEANDDRGVSFRIPHPGQ